jgi:hypothetical protein
MKKSSLTRRTFRGLKRKREVFDAAKVSIFENKRERERERNNASKNIKRKTTTTYHQKHLRESASPRA